MGGQAKFQGLDGLRGVAALAVVIYHGQSLLALPILPYGYLAVDFFFMLSGFVMAHAYQDRVRAGMPLLAFLRGRAIRLFPTVVVAVILGAIARWWTRRLSGIDLAEALPLQLALIPVPDLARPTENLWVLDPSAWSLFWEVCANLALFAFLARWSDRRLRILCATCAVALFGVVIRIYSLDAGPVRAGWFGGAARVFFAFPLGMLIWRVWHRGRLALAGRAIDLRIVAVALLACLAAPSRYGFVDLAIVLLAFPALLLAAIGSQAAAGGWQWAARISYPLYLCHYSVLFLFQNAAARGAVPFAGFVAAASLVGAAMTVWWDEPARRWLSRKSAAPTHGGGTAATCPAASLTPS